MPVRNITSEDAFDNLLVENRVAVIEFYSSTSGSCKAIAPVFDQYAPSAALRATLQIHYTIGTLCIMIADDGSCSDWEKFHAVSFFRVDAGELPQLSKHRGVTAMPTFQLYVGGDKVDEIKGSNQTALVGLIEAVL